MSSSLHQTVAAPVTLGEAPSFNRTIFPLSSYRKGESLYRGDLFLDATLDEMLKIINVGAILTNGERLLLSRKPDMISETSENNF